MKTLICAFVVLLVIGGCSTLLKIQGQAAKQAANGVEAYCKNTDQTFRDQFQAEVDKLTAPNSLKISCGSP